MYTAWCICSGINIKKKTCTSLLSVYPQINNSIWHTQGTHTHRYPLFSVHTEMQSHTEQCEMRTGQAAQGSLAESLIDWDKGLLMRQIAHQAGTTCFSDVTPFQTSPGAHRPRHGHPIYVCVCAFMCVCLSLVNTLKTNWHWLAFRPSGSPWPHPDMSSVGVRWWTVN